MTINPLPAGGGRADPTVAVFAANANVAAFGDFSRYYVVRDVVGVRFERSDDYAFANDLVTFSRRIGWLSTEGPRPPRARDRARPHAGRSARAGSAARRVGGTLWGARQVKAPVCPDLIAGYR